MTEFKTLESYHVQKPFWFLVRLKSNIELIEEGGVQFKRLTESLVVVSFEDLQEAQLYFDTLQNQENIEFSILTDYTKY